MIRCLTLGPASIELDGAGTPPELTWRKNIALLVYLARSPKRARSREHLIGLLWGGRTEADARHSLNVALSTLRRHVGEAGLESDATHVRLAPGAVELDTDRLEALAGAGDHRAAVELIRGEFLEGLRLVDASGFDDWMTAERLHWQRRSVEILVHRAAEVLDGGDVAGANDLVQRARALDWHSETAVRAAMRGLALAGDRAGALALFDEFATRLAQEFATAPDAETRALAERVRRERAWRLPATGGAPAPGSGGEGRRTPLVGRGAELERLTAAWAACLRERHAALAVIEGDPGMGKTRLADELVARARLDGAAVAAVRAVEADSRDPWSGVTGIARGGLLDAPGVAGAPPPALAQLRGTAAPDAPGRALAEVLQAVSDEQPVLLFVDDAHWLDRESFLAIGAAARSLAQAPLLVLLTTAATPSRDELDELRARVGRELGGTSVRLGTLRSDALRALVRWALPSYDDVQLDRVTRRVATDSAGIPLLAVELLRAVAAGLDLRLTGGAWPAPLHTLDQTLPGDLPDAIVAAIRINFRRLSAPAQRALVAAAVLGSRVPGPALARASELAREEAAAALDELEWQGWLTAEARGYAFVARIVQDVVGRDMVTAGQRQRIAAAAAAAGGVGGAA